MKIDEDIQILPEDCIVLTNDQQNLVVLALKKQLPPEDAAFIKRVKESITKNVPEKSQDLFAELTGYYTTKYGMDFGVIYLAAIIGGKKKYAETVKSVESLKAVERIVNKK